VRAAPALYTQNKILPYQRRFTRERDEVIHIWNGNTMMFNGNSSKLNKQQPGLAGSIRIGDIKYSPSYLYKIGFTTPCAYKAYDLSEYPFC